MSEVDNNDEITITTIGDGNCLFRCFSVFLYNNQNSHLIVRKEVVAHIVINWLIKKDHIIGNEYYPNVLNEIDYQNYMCKNQVYGNEIEISSFAEKYNVYLKVKYFSTNTIHQFGNINIDRFLFLQISGTLDAGHYDIIRYINNHNVQESLTSAGNDENSCKKDIIRKSLINHEK